MINVEDGRWSSLAFLSEGPEDKLLLRAEENLDSSELRLEASIQRICPCGAFHSLGPVFPIAFVVTGQLERRGYHWQMNGRLQLPTNNVGHEEFAELFSDQPMGNILLDYQSIRRTGQLYRSRARTLDPVAGNL